jgi:metallo-beta-lactamase family protein
MKLYFYGGAENVTGVKFLLEAKANSKKSVKILVDCGTIQGAREDEEENYKDFVFNPAEIDYVFVTHAHIDHIGLVPKLCKEGFKGKIFTTAPTIDLARLTLEDSCNLLKREARKLGREPLYTKKDIDKALTLMNAVHYNKKRKLEDEIYFRFQDAGHILGSAIIELWVEGKKLVFSGDLGNEPAPFLNPLAKITEADYILIESTYGNRIHEGRLERKEALENTIEETFGKKGVVMIPAFAVERTQELLFELNELVENNRIPKVPIFIDSPLAIKVTGIYKKHQKYFNKKATYLIKSGDDLFNFPGLTLTENVEKSKAINRVSPPKIIIAGSGMSTGGRIVFHEKNYLPDQNNCLIIISFQARGSLGRRLLEGAKKVNIFNEEVPVKAKVVSIEGYSSHADQKALYGWLTNFSKPVKHIFAIHGEKEASEELVQKIKDHLGMSASVPKKGEMVEL